MVQVVESVGQIAVYLSILDDLEIGDSDLVRPEHAVEMFRLLGGGVFGDTPAGLPDSQLAILPGTSHVTVPSRVDLLLAIVPAFLDRPVPGTR